MAKKADFTSEEWQLILSMPQVAALYLALASPSGPLGLAQEMIASTRGLVETLKSSSGNELVDAVAADVREKAENRERMEPPLEPGRDANEIKAKCLQSCRDVAALLAQRRLQMPMRTNSGCTRLPRTAPMQPGKADSLGLAEKR